MTITQNPLMQYNAQLYGKKTNMSKENKLEIHFTLLSLETI